MEITLLDEPAPVSKELVPFRLFASFTKDGRLARVLFMGLNTFPGGDTLQNLDIDLTPVREYTDIGEVPEHVMEKLRELSAAATAKTKAK
jgi:hypothetical protein